MGECVDLLSDNEPNSVSDTEDEASDTEDLHGHVNMKSLDDDFEGWEGIQSDV